MPMDIDTAHDILADVGSYTVGEVLSALMALRNDKDGWTEPYSITQIIRNVKTRQIECGVFIVGDSELAAEVEALINRREEE
jgi:hypothetical protein